VKLAIAVPTYNEAKNIQKLLPALKKNLANYPKLKTTVYIVDDNSPDGTADIADAWAAKNNVAEFKATTLRRAKKEGLGKAYVYAFNKILKKDYDYILQMDADLSHNPTYIPAFLDEAVKEADFVVGSRYIKGGATPDWSWNRRLLSRSGNMYTRLMLGSRITDYTGGFNLYSANLLNSVDLDSLLAGGYGFLIELKYRALSKCQAVAQVPIVFMDRTHGESKLPKDIIIKNLLLVAKIKTHSNAK
jgi:dolichol-phosphate mannosyltransferase